MLSSIYFRTLHVHVIFIFKVSFKELDEMTDVLAENLKFRGVGRGNIVGIFMEKSLEYVAAYIAILKAGKYI